MSEVNFSPCSSVLIGFFQHCWFLLKVKREKLFAILSAACFSVAQWYYKGWHWRGLLWDSASWSGLFGPCVYSAAFSGTLCKIPQISREYGQMNFKNSYNGRKTQTLSKAPISHFCDTSCQALQPELPAKEFSLQSSLWSWLPQINSIFG